MSEGITADARNYSARFISVPNAKGAYCDVQLRRIPGLLIGHERDSRDVHFASGLADW